MREDPIDGAVEIIDRQYNRILKKMPEIAKDIESLRNKIREVKKREIDGLDSGYYI